MAKAVAIVLVVINVIVAAVVLYLSMTVSDPKPASKRCDITRSDEEVNVSCVSLGLTDIPKSVPDDATRINLQQNMLSKITEDSFGCLEQLRVLDLQRNIIEYLEKDSIRCITKLSHLFLSHNFLNYSYESLPVGLFSPLKHLQELKIDQQLRIPMNMSYPEMTFMDLTNIESQPTLYFGTSFSKMERLRDLHLSSPVAVHVRNDSFAGFSHHDVNMLDIGRHFGKIVQLDIMSFRHLNQLQMLILYNLQICLHSIMDSLNVFSGRNMSVIQLVGYDGWFGNDMHKQQCNMVLSSNITKHLLSICVERVYMIGHGIRFIQQGTFNQKPFVDCVKLLDLGMNCITVNKEVYMELKYLKNLENLGMEMRKCVRVPDVNSVHKSNSSVKINSELSTNCFETDDAWNQPIRGVRLDCRGKILHIHFPSKLKILNLSGLFRDLSLFNCVLKLHGAENLIHADVSHWNVRTQFTKVLGANSLKFVDFTRNQFIDFDWFLFRTSTNIDTLILISSSLGITGPCFSNVPKELKYLNLGMNNLQDFPFRPEELSNISQLDLSDNLIRYFSSETRQGLDQIVREGREITLNLRGNILSCGCASLHFLEWMTETDVQFQDWYLYKCLNEDGDVIDMSESGVLYLKYWRKCNGRFWLAFTVIIGFLFITSFVICVMLDKYSLRLKCILLKWFGLRFQVPKREDFLYDIFVYYSSKDDHTWVCNTFRQKMEEERGLRLCIPDRDFVPGSCTAEEILEAIHKSWKTVIYMTEVFLEDELCFFTLSSAVYASTNEMPNRLILLYSNDIFNKPLPPIVTQLLDGDDNFMLEELEELEQWDILHRKILCWV